MSEQPDQERPREDQVPEGEGIEAANQIDTICDEFERDRSSDNPQSIEVYLDHRPGRKSAE